MNEQSKTTEQLILEAAENEFLEKGFSGTKTTQIAQKAGVTHAMLHYYFRTKENLFQMVFQKKLLLVVQSIAGIYNSNLTFEDTIRKIVETHFDFVSQNPRLIGFVYNEIVSNQKNREELIQVLIPNFTQLFSKLTTLLDKESSEGHIRPIKPYNLIMNIISMNLVTFMAVPIMQEMTHIFDASQIENIIKERKESNVQFILNALKA